MRYAYPVLARRGLGNMLFTWAQAAAYCHRTGAQMIAPVWARISRIGPWLRGERYKRFYGGEFTNAGYAPRWRRWFGDVKVFCGMEGFFDPFIKEQRYIRDELWRIVSRRISDQVMKVADEGPFIGVHIRRGDFSSLGLATGNEWYVSAIAKALENDKGVKTIRIFTDGYPEEVAFVAQVFPDLRVIVMPKAPAIQDILLLSMSAKMVCSPRSTFSMWAVFLGQMPSVWKSGESVPRLYSDADRMVVCK